MDSQRVTVNPSLPIPSINWSVSRQINLFVFRSWMVLVSSPVIEWTEFWGHTYERWWGRHIYTFTDFLWKEEFSWFMRVETTRFVHREGPEVYRQVFCLRVKSEGGTRNKTKPRRNLFGVVSSDVWYKWSQEPTVVGFVCDRWNVSFPYMTTYNCHLA